MGPSRWAILVARAEHRAILLVHCHGAGQERSARSRMRLINVDSLSFEEFIHEVPSYAILSHTWGEDKEELSFLDVQEGNVSKEGIGLVKLQGCCTQAKKDGLQYVWIDTCCIDKDKLTDLSEAINSMFRWYRRAEICYAYLSDVPVADSPQHRSSSDSR